MYTRFERNKISFYIWVVKNNVYLKKRPEKVKVSTDGCGAGNSKIINIVKYSRVILWESKCKEERESVCRGPLITLKTYTSHIIMQNCSDSSSTRERYDV
jgi:hypothetical protein